jgi:hypothetical protein
MERSLVGVVQFLSHHDRISGVTGFVGLWYVFCRLCLSLVYQRLQASDAKVRGTRELLDGGPY